MVNLQYYGIVWYNIMVQCKCRDFTFYGLYLEVEGFITPEGGGRRDPETT